jgi:hypothetical protein
LIFKELRRIGGNSEIRYSPYTHLVFAPSASASSDGLHRLDIAACRPLTARHGLGHQSAPPPSAASSRLFSKRNDHVLEFGIDGGSGTSRAG